MRKTTLALLPLLIAALAACKDDEKPASEKAVATAAATPAAETAAAAPPAAEEAKEEVAAKDEGPIPDIPEGRSKPPTVAEWSDAASINTQEANSQPDKCFMKIVREWLKVHCEGDIQGTSGMENFGNELGNYFQSVKPGKLADFVVRMRKGKTMKLRIQRTEGEAVLFVNWPQDSDKPTIVALGKGLKK